MCGISGYFIANTWNNSSSPIFEMTASIEHRGPDDGGFVLADVSNKRAVTFSSVRSPETIQNQWPLLKKNTEVLPHQLAMGQVRYSVIDLSPGGHQPMWSSCGNYCLTFNGEIYNYLELKNELAELGFRFNTFSDTEILLNGCIAWGEDVFCRLNGFFSVVFYDLKRKAILLGRDRIGKANFYFTYRKNEYIYWASEIKALLEIGIINHKNINNASVVDFILFNRRDRAGTFWHDVLDFPPAHFAWIDESCTLTPMRYWALPSSRLTVNDLSLEEAVAGLTDVLTDSLDIRLRADVPIGFELSGGMDSSALAGLAAGRLGRKIRTYTVEFPEAHSNEAPFARAVAQHHRDQIEYHAIKPPKEEFWLSANDYVWLQEEPFHSPNLHTAQCMERIIKKDGSYVVITGAAGDEMLAGYAGDYLAPFFRHLLGRSNVLTFFSEFFRNTEIKSYQIIKWLFFDLFLSQEQRALMGMWRIGELDLLKLIIPQSFFLKKKKETDAVNEKTFHGRTVANMTYRLMNYWLRSGMKSSYGIPIETRAPFLDYRVVEFCTQLPPEYLIHQGWHKYVLRKAVEKYLPKEVVWRCKKMGFPFPYREWLTANRSVIEKNIINLDCEFVSSSAFIKNYERMITVCPIMSWRLISVLLWWKKMIERKNIIAC